MSATSTNPAFPALCALLLLWPVGAAAAAAPAAAPASAPAGMASVAVLQAEFLRRINHGEQVSSLFDPRGLIPDLGGLRRITVLEDRTATQGRPTPGTDSVRARLRVQVRLQAPFSSDCPAVDEFLARSDENTRTWDEAGWLEIVYRRVEAGWQITGLQYRAEESQP
jgi:hypothetical protein